MPLADNVRLNELPDGVLHRIMQLADQASREACMLTCKSLSTAARAKGVWSAVTFYDVGQPSALEFMDFHAVRDVAIITTCPDDVACFFQRLAGMGVDCIETLRIDVLGDQVQRVPRDFLTGMCLQTSLRHLTISVENIEDTCEVFFPRGLVLPSLESIDIREKCKVEQCKELVVWWHGARLPNLRRAVVDVMLSDVMANLHTMTSLRHLTYRCDDEGGETYQDVSAAGACLDVLDFNVGCETDYGELFEKLAHATVKKLVITVSDDLVDFRYPVCHGLEELVLRMDITHGIVHLDFAHLAQATSLRCVRVELEQWVLDAGVETEHYLEFNHTPSIDEWLRFCARVSLVCPHPSVKVTISKV